MHNNFEISLVGFMPNIITNHAITYTKTCFVLFFFQFLIKTWSHHLDDKARTRYRQALLALWECNKILCFLMLIFYCKINSA